MLSKRALGEYTIDSGIQKVHRTNKQVLVSAFLAGAYITFGALGSLGASYNLLANPDTYGLGKLVAALMFPVGLIFVLIAGADLFTGNILLIMAYLKKAISWRQMWKNWIIVWIGNLLGAILVAFLVYQSQVFNWSDGLYGGVVLKNAVTKLNYDFISLVASGILCNWLVCLTVWMSYAAKDIVGKVLVSFAGIFLFVCAGYEHSIANMGYLFAAYFSKTNPQYLEMAHKSVETLTIENMFLNNLIPVTIGNIIGGAIFVGLCYYYLYVKE